MQKLFPEFYGLSAEQINDLSKDAVIAFDASFLLDFYRFSKPTADNMFSVVEGLQRQIWVPHQAAFEFHSNRLNVLAGLRSKHATLLKSIEEDGAKMVKGIEAACTMHPLLDGSELTGPIKEAIASSKKRLSQVGDKHTRPTNNLADDPIWTRIVTLFEGRVGSPYTVEILSTHEKEAKRRCEKKIPPGFEDAKKAYPYGDYLLWRQLLDHCKRVKRPGIFVTSDVKDDWWLEHQGNKLGALPGLRREFWDETGKEFHIYRTSHFIEVFAPRFQVSPEEPIKEIRRIRNDRSIKTEIEEAFRNRMLNTKTPWSPEDWTMSSAAAQQRFIDAERSIRGSLVGEGSLRTQAEIAKRLEALKRMISDDEDLNLRNAARLAAARDEIAHQIQMEVELQAARKRLNGPD